MGDSLGVYLLRRLLLAIPMLLGISLATFVALAAWLSPLWKIGASGCGLAAQKAQCPPDIVKLASNAHLYNHLVVRWWIWLRGLFTGQSGRPAVARSLIWPQVWAALAHTGVLLVLALILIVVGSIALGTFAARRAGKPDDLAIRAVGYASWSIPTFLAALLIQQLFARLALDHGFQPFFITGIPGPEAGTGFHFVLDWLRHLTLPVTALAAGFIGGYARYVRSVMLVSLHAPYATTARAKGLSESQVTVRHALRTSLIPFVNVLALDFGALFGASLAVDYVFDQHGLASFLVQALFDSDPYEVEPVILVAAGVVLLSRLFADVTTRWLDPRVRLA